MTHPHETDRKARSQPVDVGSGEPAFKDRAGIVPRYFSAYPVLTRRKTRPGGLPAA